MCKTWSNEEVEILVNSYCKLTKEDICNLLPGRLWHSIKLKASKLGLNKKALKVNELVIVEDFKNLSYRDVLLKYNISQTSLYRILDKYDVDRRKLTEFGDDKEFENNYLTKSKEELTQIYNTKYTNVKQHASSLGIKRPNELILYKESKTNIEVIRYEYLVLNLTADQIASKHKNEIGYSRENIQGILKRNSIIKDSAIIREQKITTRFATYGSAWVSGYGKEEAIIQDWLNSFGFNFNSDFKILSGYEIDFYEESINLGIEYNGLRWHSNLFNKNKTSRNNKRLGCEAKGVRLITIFEDEWLERKDQVKGFLRSVLNKNENRLYARKCEVREIEVQEANKFIELYHIQGANSLGKYFAGLFYNNELIGVMSFGRHPFDITDTKIWLDRLCFKSNYTVVGGASRLFKFLREQYKCNEIWSWSDNRWSQGHVYKSLGFTLEKEMDIDYDYADLKNHIRVSKQSQRKNRVNCPINLTEEQWANQRGLYKIWDCGKKRWVWRA
jgi:hypothetical protein